MNIDFKRRYTSSDEYFALHGSVAMKISAEAAIAVCVEAAKRGLVVARVEGGVWHNPGFEACIDCIWDGLEPPISLEVAHANNLAAADFVRAEDGRHDVFVLTTPSITGW